MSVSDTPQDFDTWLEAVLKVWAQTAPSYVQHDVKPLKGHLRAVNAAGITPEQFREALEIAFVVPGQTQRSALARTYSALGVKL